MKCTVPRCTKPFHGYWKGQPYCKNHYFEAKGSAPSRKPRKLAPTETPLPKMKGTPHRHKGGTTTRLTALVSTECAVKLKAAAQKKGVALHAYIVDVLEKTAELL